MIDPEGDEFLYVLVNRSFPGMVKIGRTDRRVQDRVRELSTHSGVPTEFTVFREFRVNDSVIAERAVHRRLKEYRVAANREFFAIDPETAADVIQHLVGHTNRTPIDRESEDDLLAQATILAQNHGKVWPSMVASILNISLTAADDVIDKLKGRGVLSSAGKLNFPSRRYSMAKSLRPPALFPDSAISTAENTSQSLEPNRLPQDRDGSYQFPPITLLKECGKPFGYAIEEEVRSNAENLLHIFHNLDVDLTLSEMRVGPVRSRYSFTLAAGVPLERIAELEGRIVQQMNRRGTRIVPVVPGQSVLQVEVPNNHPTPAGLREVIETEAWCELKAAIPIGIGAVFHGEPIVFDLAKISHLLVASSNGAEKASCIKAILTCALFALSPKDLRLVIIDPSMIELTRFNSIPHMLIPAVTDPEKAPATLDWLLCEMTMRYRIFAHTNVRNITEFNSRTRKNRRASSTADDTEEQYFDALDRMPFLVVIINELADLLATESEIVESRIARLIKTAGAAGIHLIVATQRVSENVITEKLKANTRSRIAFHMSQLDSRTFLGAKGAEELIGRGDMLFATEGTSEPIRAQCALVSDEEVQEMVEFLKRNGPPQYAQSVQQQIDRTARDDEESNEGGDDDLGDDEELYQQALDVLRSTKRASTSMIQRRLSIGYNRAARILDLMEEKGIVGPENGSSPREILVDLDNL
jgi:S-DNA-T family DNA segregation ATPase FtsK/SpoIIIE